MAETDLGKIKMTDAELLDFILQCNGGVRLGKDADGNPGYVVTDADTGADTVVPFSSGGGAGFEGGDILTFSGTSSTSTATLLSTSISATTGKDYKKILVLAIYVKADSYNELTDLEIFSTSSATYDPKEEWNCNNLSSNNRYLYYAVMASLRGEVKSGEKLYYMVRASLSSTATTSKYIMGAIIGFY